MLAGKQLLLDELSSDLQRELNDLKKKGEVVCVQGVKKKASKYVCQRCGNIEQRLFASFLCKRCSKVCTYLEAFFFTPCTQTTSPFFFKSFNSL
ncbi:hypothetical protein ACT4US_08145, partial [Bacillus sp. HC-Mk]